MTNLFCLLDTKLFAALIRCLVNLVILRHCRNPCHRSYKFCLTKGLLTPAIFCRCVTTSGVNVASSAHLDRIDTVDCRYRILANFSKCQVYAPQPVAGGVSGVVLRMYGTKSERYKI